MIINLPDMTKKYSQPEEEDNQENNLNEPTTEYGMETEMTFSPPLTEEELAEAITGEELLEAVKKHIHELFNKK